jgi:hypothetical protein
LDLKCTRRYYVPVRSIKVFETSARRKVKMGRNDAREVKAQVRARVTPHVPRHVDFDDRPPTAATTDTVRWHN